MLRHQLSAPLVGELAGAGVASAAEIARRTRSCHPPIETLGALFCSPSPPIELLEMAKNFAKACKAGGEESLPPEIADVIYCAAIVAALVKCGKRITALDDKALARGITEVLGHSWLDDRTRSLLQNGQAP
jgi:hypothetical protein